MSTQFPYRFNVGEPSIFVEIYLPKKADFQGALYDTLSRGFDLVKLYRHFEGVRSDDLDWYDQKADAHTQEDEPKPDPEKVRRMCDLLRREYEELVCQQADGTWTIRPDLVDFFRTEMGKDLQEQSHFFLGHSMYEVDGVFFIADADKKPAARRVQERVQVIRLMFRFDVQEVFPECRPQKMETANEQKKRRRLREELDTLTRVYLRAPLPRDDPRAFLKMYPNYQKKVKARQAIPMLVLRVQLLGLFIFGYVVFELCEAILKRNKQVGQHIEQEVWVTSWWNLVVNRIIFADSQKSTDTPSTGGTHADEPPVS